MERVRAGTGGRLGILAAAWIGGLGGFVVGAYGGQGTTLIQGAFFGYGIDGYYASGTVVGFMGGAFLGAIVGLAAGAALVGRFGNRGAALLGGVLGIVGAAVYGVFAYPLAVFLEGAYLGDPTTGALLGAIAFAAAGGVLAVGLRGESPGTARRAALRDLLAGGIVGSFFGMLGGGFTKLAISAWVVYAYPVSPSMNDGLVLGFFLGAGVGAAVAVLVGALVRLLGQRQAPGSAPSGSPLEERTGKAVRIRTPR